MPAYSNPTRTGDSAHIEIDGPEISVGTEAATNVSLVVHELATNVVKHGVLSVLDGGVHISCASVKGCFTLFCGERVDGSCYFSCYQATSLFPTCPDQAAAISYP